MNPYWKVHRLESRNRARARPIEAAWSLLGPVVLGGLAAPLARPVLLGFLDGPKADLAGGLAGLVLRLGLALCGAGVLLVHERVVRGTERAILDPHPADPAALVPALGFRLARTTAGLCGGAAALLTPMLFCGHARAFLLTLPLLFGGWLCGISLGFLSQLGAVGAARSGRLVGLLELVRGSAPPMQAALIWAPGLALAACGAALVAGTRGLEQVLLGAPGAGVLLALPLTLAVVGWLPVEALAARTWYAATTLIAEVDAAWAAVEDPEAARRVYLEWTVRWAPPALRAHLLRTLRAGWRAHRGWVLSAWGFGALAALAGWTDSAAAGPRALLVAASALVLLGALGVLLETGDPPWLVRAIGIEPGHRVLARALAVWAYLQGALLPPCAAVLLRRDPAEALGLVAVLEALALAASATSALLGLARQRAWFAYPPLALLLWILAARSLP